MTERVVRLSTSGSTIDYNVYGADREASGISKVVLEPLVEHFNAVVGEEVTYRVVAVHRETVETL